MNIFPVFYHDYRATGYGNLVIYKLREFVTKDCDNINGDLYRWIAILAPEWGINIKDRTRIFINPSADKLRRYVCNLLRVLRLFRQNRREIICSKF